MELLKREWLAGTPDRPNQLTVLQWNCLADWASYAFPKVEPSFLDWKHRKPLIVAECLRASPDIFCLQEVDHFDELKESFSGEYDGLFFPKGKSPGTTGKDGAAIFWRSKFKLVNSQQFHFSVVCNAPEMGQIVGVVHLKCSLGETETNVQIVTTHLKAKAEHEATRVKQGIALAEILVGLQDKNPDLAIVCGDFNTTKDSEAIQAMLSRGFTDAYSSVGNSIPNNTEPAWTTWKIREQVKKCTIDFVFYRATSGRESNWRLVDVWNVPNESLIDPNVALPCGGYPSDHCALAVKFELGE